MSSNLVPNIKKSLEINFKMEFTLYIWLPVINN